MGWNTRLVDGVWIPTFPCARYVLGAADIDYWARSEDPLHAAAFADSVQPVIDAGLVDAGLVDAVAADTALTRDTLVLGTHFADTGAGRVLSTEDGYRFAPEPHS